LRSSPLAHQYEKSLPKVGRATEGHDGSTARQPHIQELDRDGICLPLFDGPVNRTGIGQRKCTRGLNNAQLLVNDSTVRATNPARTSDLVANAHGIDVRLTYSIMMHGTDQ
jgi:hypothetical protein